VPEESTGRFVPSHEALPVSPATQLDWQHSRMCSINGSCVEIAALSGGGVAIRDGKLGEASPVLTFTQEEWDAFAAGVKAGEFG
jgi:Domain of unknown function (DUF397)